MITYSIIIPTRNQSRKLRYCLDHISRLNFDPHLFEVLVIDNGSTDDTEKVAVSFRETISNMQYHHCRSPGLMAARHMGFDNATGDILCYLDDDSLVAETWLEGISDSFRDDDIIIAGGPCIPRYEVAPPRWIAYFWDDVEYGQTNGFLSLLDLGNEIRLIDPIYIYGCNFSIRKNTFLEYGGTCPDYYPKNYQQFQGMGESALTIRLRHAGIKALYNPKTKIEHLIPPDRLSTEYFVWRMFYSGIHDSYWKIRNEHCVEDSCIHKKPPLLKYARNVSFRIFCEATCVLRGGDSRVVSAYHRHISKRGRDIKKSYKKGFSYHQLEAKNDALLLEWILRDNYLGNNGDLPINTA